MKLTLERAVTLFRQQSLCRNIVLLKLPGSRLAFAVQRRATRFNLVHLD